MKNEKSSKTKDKGYKEYLTIINNKNMSLRNPEIVNRLIGRLQGNLVNLKLIVKSQQPVEDYLKKVEETEEILSQLSSTLEREGAELRNF